MVHACSLRKNCIDDHNDKYSYQHAFEQCLTDCHFLNTTFNNSSKLPLFIAVLVAYYSDKELCLLTTYLVKNVKISILKHLISLDKLRKKSIIISMQTAQTTQYWFTYFMKGDLIRIAA